MIIRELLRFSWRYDNGKVILFDKTKDKEQGFEFPITYLDSLMRAGIVFKNHYRMEMIEKQAERNKKLKLIVKALRNKKQLKLKV